MRKLNHCNKCKEDSVKTKCYTRKSDGKRCRTSYCINKGCGCTLDLPIIKVGGVANV